MAKRIKVGQVEVKVTNADQDGHAIQFQAKLKPKQYTGMLTSKNGLCVSKNGKHYVRFEDCDNLQLLLSEIKENVKTDFRSVMVPALVKAKVGGRKHSTLEVDIANSFNTDLEGVAGLILFPGQYTKFKAYDTQKFKIKDCKSVTIEHYANAVYRVTLSVGTVNVTVADDDDSKRTLYVQPYINVSILTICLKKGQRPYDPDTVADQYAEQNKVKELNDLKSFFSGGPKKLRLGFTDSKVVKVQDPNLIFSDAEDDEEEEGYERKKNNVISSVDPVLADIGPDPVPQAKRQKKAKKDEEPKEPTAKQLEELAVY